MNALWRATSMISTWPSKQPRRRSWEIATAWYDSLVRYYPDSVLNVITLPEMETLTLAFFHSFYIERKKAIRKLRQIHRELSNQAETTKVDKDRLLDAQVDVNYTLYYPLNRKYISLYKSCAGDPKSQTAKDSIKAD